MLDSQELIEIKTIARLELYRWKEADITFEQLLIIRVLSGHPIRLRVYELDQERCSLGYLPLLLINGQQPIRKERIITLAQSLCSAASQKQFLNGRAVLHACQQLVEVQLLNDLQASSRYWLIMSPFKKLRSYLFFRKETQRLKALGLSESSDNCEIFAKRLHHFESLLEVVDEFSRLAIDSCLELFRYRDSELTKLVLQSQPLRHYRLMRATQLRETGARPVLSSELRIASPKPPKEEEQPQEQARPKPDPNPDRIFNNAAREGLARTVIAVAALWLPMFVFKMASGESNQ